MAANLLAGLTGTDPVWLRDRLTDIEIAAVKTLVDLIPVGLRSAIGWFLAVALMAATIGLALVYLDDWRHPLKQHAQSRSAAPMAKVKLHAIGGKRVGEQRSENLGSRR